MSENNMVQVYSTGVQSVDDVQRLKLEIQNFHEDLNKRPDPKTGASRNGNSYVVISHIEMMLDEMFYGHWSTENFQYKQIANEIVGSITLKYMHPKTGVWLTREGAASVQIMQDRGAKISTIMDTKKKNALETGFPKLKAMCLKNASATIGKMFGRDLNRDNQAEYEKQGLEDRVFSPEQVLKVLGLIDGSEDLMNKVLKSARVESIEMIPENRYERIISWLEEKCSK